MAKKKLLQIIFITLITINIPLEAYIKSFANFFWDSSSYASQGVNIFKKTIKAVNDYWHVPVYGFIATAVVKTSCDTLRCRKKNSKRAAFVAGVFIMGTLVVSRYLKNLRIEIDEQNNKIETKIDNMQKGINTNTEQLETLKINLQKTEENLKNAIKDGNDTLVKSLENTKIEINYKIEELNKSIDQQNKDLQNLKLSIENLKTEEENHHKEVIEKLEVLPDMEKINGLEKNINEKLDKIENLLYCFAKKCPPPQSPTKFKIPSSYRPTHKQIVINNQFRPGKSFIIGEKYNYLTDTSYSQILEN